MAQWNVILTMDVTQSAIVTVEADNEKSARQAALERQADADLIWDTGDHFAGEVYVTDCSKL